MCDVCITSIQNDRLAAVSSKSSLAAYVYKIEAYTCTPNIYTFIYMFLEFRKRTERR